MFKIKAEILDKFQKAIESHQDIVLKSVDSNGTFEVIASTQSKDRHGEIVLQEGIDITNYLKNPVILFAHDYDELPIGKATSVIKETDRLIIKGVFAPTEEAQKIRVLYDAGFLKTVSIGFIAKEWEGNVITVSELLELSFVAVPANPDALDIAKGKGIEKEYLDFTAKAEKKVANADLMKCMNENHQVVMDMMGKMHDMVCEMCKKSVEGEESAEMKALKELVGIMKEFNGSLSNLDSELKNLSAQLVEKGLESARGAGEELEKLSRESVKIASRVREILKSK